MLYEVLDFNFKHKLFDLLHAITEYRVRKCCNTAYRSSLKYRNTADQKPELPKYRTKKGPLPQYRNPLRPPLKRKNIEHGETCIGAFRPFLCLIMLMKNIILWQIIKFYRISCGLKKTFLGGAYPWIPP